MKKKVLEGGAKMLGDMILKNQIVGSVNSEREWVYLVNETLAGEKTIVPMLRRILDEPVCTGPFREMIERQLDEEIQHVRLYHNLVGSYRIDRNKFRTDFSNFIVSLPTVTLKIFVLQGMLEGIATGALNYRLNMIENSPSLAVDLRALSEETGHTHFAFPHFKHLIDAEGKHTQEDFRLAARGANTVFANAYNGTEIAQVFQTVFGETLDPEKIERSDGISAFRKYSRSHIVKTRVAFLDRYFEVAG